MLEALDVRIREATDGDLPELEWDGEFICFRRLYQQAMLDAKKGKRVILIAELDAQVIGQIFVNFHSTWRKSFHGQISGYLHSFRVKPGFRNQSVGRTLIAKAEGILKEHRYRGAVISVARTNEAALRLYQHLGYEVFREDPGQWSFIDHNNKVQHVSEPAFILYRNL